jgi:hypothetical protein
MTHSEADKVSVNLIASDDGADRIAIKLGEQPAALVLTPAQARALATELIAAVNRAEVKTSLKSSQNLWRRAPDPQSRLATVG